MECFTFSLIMIWLDEKEVQHKLNDSVQEKGKEAWSQRVCKKSSLECYKWETKPKCEAFDDGSHPRSVLLFRARNKS